MINANLIALKSKRNLIFGEIFCDSETANYKVVNFVLLQRNSSNKKIYKFPVKFEKKNNIFFEVDVNYVDWQPYYWDAYIEVEINNKIDLIRVKVKNSKIRFKMNLLPFIKSINISQGYHLFPYITFHGSLSFTYKEKKFYETKQYQWRWLFALLIYFLLKPYWASKKLWIGFEKNSARAQDNGFAFFQYCYKNKKHSNFYYVIQEDSSDIKYLDGMEDRVLKFMSFKYMVYLLASTLLISSETKAHIYDIKIQRGLIRRIINTKKQIFLQHGVIGLKKVDNIFHYNSNNRADLFITSSEYEKSIITTHFGYHDNLVEVTGLSRWDQLKNASTGKNILVMPTWRSWMDSISDDDFILTNYYQTYMNMIASDELVKVIEENNLFVTFLLHPKFTQYVHLFKSLNERITVCCDGFTSVQKEIEKAALMVTDFSSVAWDMFYLGKPVVFYQFDHKEYLENQGSYLDFSSDLFGEQVKSLRELINTVQEYAENGFKEKEIFKKKRSKYFAYNDQNNNERIFNTIVFHLPRLYKSGFGLFKTIMHNLKGLNKKSFNLNKNM